MNYELYYNTGGHCGPYPDHETACNRAEALLKGCRTMNVIEVRPRNSEHRGGYAPGHRESTYIVKNKDGLVSAQNF